MTTQLNEQQTDLITVAESWPEKARSITIESDAGWNEAGTCLQGIKALRNEAGEVFDPPIAAAHLSHKAAIAAKKGVEAPLIEAERILKGGMARYRDEQERVRREEQRRLEAIARKAAEDERLAEAIALEEAGETEAAEQVIEAPAPLAPVVVLPPATPKVSGISSAVTYKAKVVDLLALVRHVAANPALIHLVKESQPDLNGMARRQKEAFSLPGVEVVAERSIRAGAGR